jgi:hypothetical protein
MPKGGKLAAKVCTAHSIFFPAHQKNIICTAKNSICTAKIAISTFSQVPDQHNEDVETHV